jgi:hypothetical protein
MPLVILRYLYSLQIKGDSQKKNDFFLVLLVLVQSNCSTLLCYCLAFVHYHVHEINKPFPRYRHLF